MLMLLTKSALIDIKLEKLQRLPHMAARRVSISDRRAESDGHTETLGETEKVTQTR